MVGSKKHLIGLCVFFGGFACREVKTTNHFENAETTESSSAENQELSIVGGQVVSPQPMFTSKPFFASLRVDDEFGGLHCGGTFIDDNLIVSAAHCVHGMIVKNLSVAVGEIRNLSNQTTKRRARIERVIIHPDYDPNTLKNDIALLVVDQSERQNLQLIQKISLNQDPSFPESIGKQLKTSGTGLPYLFAIGFGETTSYGSLPALSLQQVKLPIIPINTCRQLSGMTEVDTSQICAGSIKSGGIDSCQGDSGGPLLTFSVGEKLPKLVGLTSYGDGCALPNKPGVYTRVSHFVPWIEKTRAALNSLEIPPQAALTNVISERCFSLSNRTNFWNKNTDDSIVGLSISPRYSSRSVVVTSKPTSDLQPTSSCAVPKSNLQVGFSEQTREGFYATEARFAGQEFKVEKIPADVSFYVRCDDLDILASPSDSYFDIRVGEENFSAEKFLSGDAASAYANGNLISKCMVPSRLKKGWEAASIELRKNPDGSASGPKDSVYISIVIKDDAGRTSRFGISAVPKGGESADLVGPYLEMSAQAAKVIATGRNESAYLVSLQNIGTDPVINWEFQCNRPFSANFNFMRQRTGLIALDAKRKSAVLTNEKVKLSGYTERTGWHAMVFPPASMINQPIGLNGRIDAGKSVGMLLTVAKSDASSISCGVNYVWPESLSNPPIPSGETLAAKRFLTRSVKWPLSLRSNFTKIFGQ